jgi:hypothetical protein
MLIVAGMSDRIVNGNMTLFLFFINGERRKLIANSEKYVLKVCKRIPCFSRKGGFFIPLAKVIGACHW